MQNSQRQRAAHRRAALGALLLTSTGVLADSPAEIDPVVVSATRSGDEWAQAALSLFLIHI